MTTLFPDVSHYQAGLSLRGAAAVIAKASQGSGDQDAAFMGFRAQAKTLGIPFAAYHWVDTSPVGEQARNCLRTVGPDMPMMWDCEAAGATVPRIADLTNAYRSLGGQVRMVYLPHWWWEKLGSPDLRLLARLGLVLIASNYPKDGYSDNGPGWQPYGGVAPTIWQYTSTQPFNGKRIDFNAYRGTVAQLASLWSGRPAMEEDHEMTPAQQYTLHVINYRVEAMISGKTAYAVPAFTATDGSHFPAISGTNAVAITTQALADAIGRTGGTAVDVDAIVAKVNADLRDALGDLAEGGATAVRQNN